MLHFYYKILIEFVFFASLQGNNEIFCHAAV